jgi:hypothetical protein
MRDKGIAVHPVPYALVYYSMLWLIFCGNDLTLTRVIEDQTISKSSSLSTREESEGNNADGNGSAFAPFDPSLGEEVLRRAAGTRTPDRILGPGRGPSSILGLDDFRSFST